MRCTFDLFAPLLPPEAFGYRTSLTNWGKSLTVAVDGKAVNIKAARPKRKPGGGRPKVYTDEVIEVLEKIWVFEGCPCGKILAEKLKNQHTPP
jgi:hypothetical protein